MVLLLAGHGVSVVAAIEWSVVLGCLLSAVTLSARPPAARARPVPVTVRGPVTYAGPGLARRHKIGAAPLATARPCDG